MSGNTQHGLLLHKAGARIVWIMARSRNCVQVATPSIRKKVILQSTCGQSAATRNAHATDVQKQTNKNACLKSDFDWGWESLSLEL